MLGPIDEHTASKPSIAIGQDGEPHLVGGTLYERSPGADPVTPGTRCFTIAQSHQTPRSLTSPVASLKREGDMINAMQECRRDLTKVILSHRIVSNCRLILCTIQAFSQIAMSTFSAVPYCDIELFMERADLLNLPRLGVDDNCMVNALQMNLAAPQTCDKGMEI